MSRGYSQPGVDRAAFAAVLQREIERRPQDPPFKYSNEGWKVCRGLADEIAASGLMSKYAARRRLYAIFNGDYADRNGERVLQKVVSLDVADRILCALDLNHLWHTELNEHIVMPPLAAAPPLAGVESHGSTRTGGRAGGGKELGRAA